MKRSILLAALATTMLAGAAPASAHHPHVAPADGGGLTGGQLLGEGWVQALSGRTAPFSGTCSTVAGDVLVSHYVEDGDKTDDTGYIAQCTATPAARLFVFFGSFCSAAENPLNTTEREQLACAISSDEAIDDLTVTVDGRRAVDIHKRRFELFSPQRSVRVPADNDFNLPAGRTTFTAHAWGAVVEGLRPGSHTVVMQLVAPDFGGTYTFTTTLHVTYSGG